MQRRGGEKQNAHRDDSRGTVEQGYDQVAHRYARLERESEWPRMRWLGKALTRLPPGCEILDLGCGSGNPADIKIARHHHVTGADVSKTQIELAARNVPEGRFIQGDVRSISFPASSFDAVVSFYALEHIPRREHLTTLRRIHGWLKPRGLLLIALEAADYEDVTANWLGVPMFFSCFDPETTRQLAGEAGFDVIETAVEDQLEGGRSVPYLWLLARRRDSS